VTRTLVFRQVDVDGELVDVRVVGATIDAVAPSLPVAGDPIVVDGHGRALIPGLHDHHMHLLATAAARASVKVGPPQVRDQRSLAAALRRADRALAPDAWLRAIGYHESVAGDLDRAALDRLVPHRPVRLQHRSGARWVLNSAAIDAIQLETIHRPELERDPTGGLTGRLHRADAWLRPLLPSQGPPDLAPVGRELARYGVTGVTDATPYSGADELEPLAAAVAQGALPQRVVVTGGPELAGRQVPAGLEWGPVKIIIDDGGYPSLDSLGDQIATAHRHDRNAAIHCVTRTALVLALAAWDAVGSRPGDRIEHGSVIPPELRPELARRRLTVVTQPGFIAERGDEYLRDVEPDDLPHLYPCRSLLDDGIPVAGSTDAPYSDANPWRAIAAATARTTRRGTVLGAAEAIPPGRALELFTGDPHEPGGPPRRVAPGAPADLCLLAVPLHEALAGSPDARAVCVTRRGGLISAWGGA
jgi:predicted amidohydrolase YtcJ